VKYYWHYRYPLSIITDYPVDLKNASKTSAIARSTNRTLICTIQNAR